MAKAPITQTLILTEDGSVIPVTVSNAVTVPPLVLSTVDNTLVSSDRPSAVVIGMTSAFAALYARGEAIIARRLRQRARRIALTTRIASLES